jgi:hypothetical protein
MRGGLTLLTVIDLFTLGAEVSETPAGWEWIIDPSLLPGTHMFFGGVLGTPSGTPSATLTLRTGGTAGAIDGTVLFASPSMVAPQVPFLFDLGLVSLTGLTRMKASYTATGTISLNHLFVGFYETFSPGLPPNLSTPGGDAELGQDIDCITDVGQSLAIASGLRNIGNALCRRLQGPLFYDADYSDTDVRDFVSAGMTPGQLADLQGRITSTIIKDERIDNPTVTVTSNPQTGALSIAILCELATGPFTFLVAVDKLTVSLLEVQSAS